MKVSLSWLKEYVPITLDPASLADALTMAGLEVEGMWDRYDYLDHVVVGRILSVEKHPDADKLSCCCVSIGDRTLEIVCGAPNVAPDMCAPVALPGAELPSGLVIKPSVIRGKASGGMLCSPTELALGASGKGIMALPETATPGTPLAQALDLSDTVMEIGLTPNRADCASVIGIAREIAAIQDVPLRYPAISPIVTEGNIFERTSITIEAPDACPRYTAKLMENVTIGPSPQWLQDRLRSVGQRPINNIVDVTNFVMLETGQPLHAFNFDALAEGRIVVRKARKGEPFTTLDDKNRVLDEEMLLICDGVKPVALAGVMGGQNSEISATTTRVLIESAYFHPRSVRKTAKKLGLSTDAAYRYERGVDPHGTLRALVRAADLMQEVAGATPVTGIVDMHPQPVPLRSIALEAEATNRLLGTALDKEQIITLLAAIDITIDPAAPADHPGHMVFQIPSYRVDIERPEDLMEEVARRYGYENIPVTMPAAVAGESSPKTHSPRSLRITCREKMIGYGFHEVLNYSFIHAGSVDRLCLADDDPRRRQVAIINPLTEEQGVMRTSLIPGLLETMGRNLSKQVRSFRIFEIGKVFFPTENPLPDEPEQLCGLWTGTRQDPSWHEKSTACDFYDIKGTVETLLATLDVPGIRFSREKAGHSPYLRRGCAARIMSGDHTVGLVGEVAPQVLSAYDLKQSAFLFELHLDRILPLLQSRKKVAPVSKFPPVSRDATLILDAHVEAHRILDAVMETNNPLVENAQLFDVFEGAPITEGKKSVSFRITYRSATETLEDEKVNRLHQEICRQIIAAFDADLP